MSRQVRRFAICLGIGVICLVGFWNRAIPLTYMCSWLNVGESPDCADYVYILPGDETVRPLVGAALVNAGLARKVLIPSTRVSADEKDGISPPTSEIVRRILLHRGISKETIISLKSANRTTFDDARVLAGYLESEPQDTVIVITNAFHTRRTRYIFREVLGRKADRLRFIAAPNPGFADDNWWQQRSGIRIVLSENIKLLFYFLRYGDLLVWCVCGSVLLTGGLIVRNRLMRHGRIVTEACSE